MYGGYMRKEASATPGRALLGSVVLSDEMKYGR